MAKIDNKNKNENVNHPSDQSGNDLLKQGNDMESKMDETKTAVRPSAEEGSEAARPSVEEGSEAAKSSGKEASEAAVSSAMETSEAANSYVEATDETSVYSDKEMEQKMQSAVSRNKKAMKRIERHRGVEIMNVFAKHNFYVNGLTPEELRTTMEDLGPTYVKIGQIMSSRTDMLPESYCKELEKLRQNVHELDPMLARAVIEEETGKKIDDLFKVFRDKPLGSASVGQAHYAVLKDGREVVVKVQRPLIADMMRKDFVLLSKLAQAFNVVAEGEDDSDNQVNLVEIIEEFKKVTEEELDFRVEAQNTKTFRENCIEDETKVSCPKVVDELTTERIFTMSFVNGYSVAKKDRMEADGYDPNEIGHALVENYAHQVLDVGMFHADPHQGNIMVSHGIPYWIDFGMVGHISDSDIGIIQSLVMSILEKDAETMTNTIMSMGASSPKTNRDKLMADLDIFFDRYCRVSSLKDLDMAVIFNEVMSLADKHSIKIPSKYTMLVRSVAAIEGVIEQLCPEVNLFEILSEKMMEHMKDRAFLESQLMNAGKDILELGKKVTKLPGYASDVLKGIARGRMKMNLELTGYEELVDKGADTTRNIAMVIFASVIFFGSCILCTADIYPKAPGGIPALAALGMVFSVALGIHVMKNMKKRK